jgi:hypothetical protein
MYRALISLLNPSPIAALFAHIKSVAAAAENYVIFGPYKGQKVKVSRDDATILAQAKRSVRYITELGSPAAAKETAFKRLTRKSDPVDSKLAKRIEKFTYDLFVKYGRVRPIKEKDYIYDSPAATYEYSRAEGGGAQEMRDLVKSLYTNRLYVHKAHMVEENFAELYFEFAPLERKEGEERWKISLQTIPGKGVKDRIVTKSEVALLFLLTPLANQATKVLKRVPGLREQFKQEPQEVAKRLSSKNGYLYSGDMTAATDSINHWAAEAVISGISKALKWTEDQTEDAMSSITKLEIHDKEYGIARVTRGTQMGLPLSFVILSVLNLCSVTEGLRSYHRMTGKRLQVDPRACCCVHGDDLIVGSDDQYYKHVVDVQTRFGFINNPSKSHLSREGGVFAGSYYRVKRKRVRVPDPNPSLLETMAGIRNTVITTQSTVKRLTSFKPSILTGSSSDGAKTLPELADMMNQLDSSWNKYRRVIMDEIFLWKKKDIKTVKQLGIPLFGPRWAGTIGFPLFDGRKLDRNTALIIGANYSTRKTKVDNLKRLPTYLKIARALSSRRKVSQWQSEEYAKFVDWYLTDARLESRTTRGRVDVGQIDKYVEDVLASASRGLHIDKKAELEPYRSLFKRLRFVQNERKQLLRDAYLSTPNVRLPATVRTGRNWVSTKGIFKLRLNGLRVTIPKGILSELQELFDTSQPQLRGYGTTD